MIEQQQAIQDAQPLSLGDVRHMTAEQWNSAVESAKKAIRESVSEPAFKEYLRSNVQDLPSWITVPVGIGLAIVALLALWVSAGKQLAAADLVFGDLTTITNRVGTLWVSTTLIAVLLLGELGSLLFSLASAFYTSARRILRAFSIGSALVALGANISITAAHPVQEVIVWQWLLTGFVPLIVLGVGLAFENMLLAYLAARTMATREYHADLETWRQAQRKPEGNAAYKNMLFRAILSALRDAQATGRRKAFDLAVATDPGFRRTAFLREFSKHSLTLDLEFDADGSPLSVYVETARQPQTRLPAAESLSAIPAVVSEQSGLSGETDNRQPGGSKRDQALAMLQADPSLASLTTRELEERTGINKSAWSEARRLYVESAHEKQTPQGNATQRFSTSEQPE